MHPSITSVEEFGYFLLYLYDSWLTMATVKNYCSAITAVHIGFADGIDHFQYFVVSI